MRCSVLSSVPLNAHFSNKFVFFSGFDITARELQHFTSFVVENNDVFLECTSDFAKITQESHVQLKQDAELPEKRPSELPLHFRERLEELLEELQQAGSFPET